MVAVLTNSSQIYQPIRGEHYKRTFNHGRPDQPTDHVAPGKLKSTTTNYNTETSTS